MGDFGSWVRGSEGRETAEDKAREAQERAVVVAARTDEVGRDDVHHDVPPTGYRERLARPKRGVEPLAKVREVADVLGVHPKTIERWRKKNGLPCLRLGGSIRYEISDVLRWASARKEG